MEQDIAALVSGFEASPNENMAVLEKNWQRIRQALLETGQLVDRFGLDSRTIRAKNSGLPISYYIYKKGLPTAILTR